MNRREVLLSGIGFALLPVGSEAYQSNRAEDTIIEDTIRIAQIGSSRLLATNEDVKEVTDAINCGKLSFSDDLSVWHDAFPNIDAVRLFTIDCSKKPGFFLLRIGTDLQYRNIEDVQEAFSNFERTETTINMVVNYDVTAEWIQTSNKHDQNLIVTNKIQNSFPRAFSKEPE